MTGRYGRVHAEYERRADDLMAWLREVAAVARSAGHDAWEVDAFIKRGVGLITELSVAAVHEAAELNGIGVAEMH
jgi:hypothetical protein